MERIHGGNIRHEVLKLLFSYFKVTNDRVVEKPPMLEFATPKSSMCSDDSSASCGPEPHYISSDGSNEGDEWSTGSLENELSAKELKTEEMLDLLKRDNVNELFCWGCFGKHYEDLEDWEMRELDKVHQIAKERLGLEFEPGRSPNLVSYRLNLDDVMAIHRPLLVYFMWWLFYILGRMLLLCKGFRRYTAASTRLIYWYRPAQKQGLLPMLFFHGIAPAGLTVYNPMAVFGLGNDGRGVFMFENFSIACMPSFEPVSEETHIHGVEKAMKTHLGANQKVMLWGHSFGSCPISWLVNSGVRNRIAQIVLLDPVTILLSEPDVVMKIVYGKRDWQAEEQANEDMEEKTKMNKFAEYCHKATIRFVVGSELFLQYYLRRHFSWYNTELWLQDLPEDCQVLICLAEKDEIINASNVKREIELHKAETKNDNIRMVYWEEVGHGYCVANSSCWGQMREIIGVQERIAMTNLVFEKDH